MAPLPFLDAAALQVVHSPEFVKLADNFLRTNCRVNDAAIKIITDQVLQSHAQKFCLRHLDDFFPDLHVSGSPDTRMVCKEVTQLYRLTKKAVLKKSRLKHSLDPISLSDPIMSMSNEVTASSPCAMRAVSQPPTTKKRRKRRRRHHRISLTDQEPVVNTSLEARLPSFPHPTRQTSATQQESENAIAETSSRVIENSATAPHSSQESMCSNSKMSVILLQGPVFKKVPVSQVVAEVSKLSETNKKLKNEIQQLQADNKTLNEYRSFVETMLQACEETYLAEAKSAKAVGIRSLSAQCDAVVNTIQDVRSDADFSYFRDYSKLHGHSPPARWWLDTSRTLRQKHDIFRS